jgi:DNA end-binding protein Ku
MLKLGGRAMATSVWKGYLTFGLVTIPIRLSTAARNERISLNQIHKPCNSRIRQPIFCPTCNRSVERSEIVKGYEYEKEQYVLFTDEELKKIEPESARTMEILEFVRLQEVDPLYFDASYHVAPEEGGAKAYQLMVEAMNEAGYGAIAKLTMHQREYVAFLRPRAKGLALHTLFYANEVREADSAGQPAELREPERKLALQLIETLAAPFQPAKYRDEYQHGLQELITAKLEGKEMRELAKPRLAPVIDLMAALKQSLAMKPGPQVVPSRPPMRAVSTDARPQKGRKKAAG